MKTLQSKAAKTFGLTAGGFTICLALSFVAANPKNPPPEESKRNVPLNTPKDSATERTVEISPSKASQPMLDPESIKKGKQNYDMFCLACHGPEDNGIDSPSNLFDPKWHYGSGRNGIQTSIKDGIIEKGMPGWGAMIPADDITALVDYLMSFQKTTTAPDE